MPEWCRHGLLALTINLQGGSPQGYSREQPWHNSAIDEAGNLRPQYLSRLEKILDRADELGMVVILGLFYFGQDQRLRDEAAVTCAVDRALDWLFERDYRNALIEVNNEDDHFDFDKPFINMVAAVNEYASWGYFDPGQSNYADGYQCAPVNWGINTARKQAFFAKLHKISGSPGLPSGTGGAGTKPAGVAAGAQDQRRPLPVAACPTFFL